MGMRLDFLRGFPMYQINISPNLRKSRCTRVFLRKKGTPGSNPIYGTAIRRDSGECGYAYYRFMSGSSDQLPPVDLSQYWYMLLGFWPLRVL